MRSVRHAVPVAIPVVVPVAIPVTKSGCVSLGCVSARVIEHSQGGHSIRLNSCRPGAQECGWWKGETLGAASWSA